MKRFAAALSLATIILIVTAFPSLADSSYEACFRSKVNAERTSRNIKPVGIDGRIDTVARDWSAKMAKAGEISHNPNLEKELPPFEYAGEDVGQGPTCDEVHAAFMNSKSHKAVMLDSDYRYVGVGVTFVSDTVFVVLDFWTPRARKPAAPSSQPSPRKLSCV